MKKNFKSIIAAVSAVSVLALSTPLTASATTAQDVVAAARGAGILETYVSQLENFLLANEFSSDQYDMMISGLGNIGNISLDVIQRYFPEINSIDDFYGRGSSDDDTTDTTEATMPDKPIINGELDDDMQDVLDKSEIIMDSMTNQDMLDAIDEIIQTGKDVGLDITAEQIGDKAFNITVKDKDGNIKLIVPIGQLVSKTGVNAQPEESNSNAKAAVGAVCAGVLTLGAAGAFVLDRKNRKAEA